MASRKPQKPVSESPKPSAKPPKPASDSPKPSAKPPKPASDSPKPSAKPPKPASDSPKPSAKPPKPVSDSPKPSAKPPKPASDSPKPSAKPPKPASDSPKPSAKSPKRASDSPKPASDSPKPGDVSTGATSDSSGPSRMTERLQKELQAPLPEEFKTFKNYGDFLKWLQKDENCNDVIEKFNFVAGKGDKIRREKNSPTIYSIVVNDVILAGKKWKFVKVGFTQIDTTIGTMNRMENVKTQIENNGYTECEVFFKLPIRAIDTTSFLDTEERIRKQFGFLVDKILAKKLKLPVKTEWVLVSQEYLTKYKEIEEGSKDTKSTSIFKENKGLKFVKELKKTSGIQNAQGLETWLKENKQFPEWLGLRDKDDTFEVYQKGDPPAALADHLARQI